MKSLPLAMVFSHKFGSERNLSFQYPGVDLQEAKNHDFAHKMQTQVKMVAYIIDLSPPLSASVDNHKKDDYQDAINEIAQCWPNADIICYGINYEEHNRDYDVENLKKKLAFFDPSMIYLGIRGNDYPSSIVQPYAPELEQVILQYYEQDFAEKARAVIYQALNEAMSAYENSLQEPALRHYIQLVNIEKNAMISIQLGNAMLDLLLGLKGNKANEAIDNFYQLNCENLKDNYSTADKVLKAVLTILTAVLVAALFGAVGGAVGALIGGPVGIVVGIAFLLTGLLLSKPASKVVRNRTQDLHFFKTDMQKSVDSVAKAVKLYQSQSKTPDKTEDSSAVLSAACS